MHERHHEAEMPPRDRNEEIASRAYARYLERGAIDGYDMEDWLEAERELESASPDLEREPMRVLASDDDDMG